MHDYLVKVKGLFESLCSTKEEVNQEQLMSYVVHGPRSRSSITIEELTNILLSDKILLKRMNSKNTANAFAASHHSRPNQTSRGRGYVSNPKIQQSNPKQVMAMSTFTENIENT